jgi:hypothetical protein
VKFYNVHQAPADDLEALLNTHAAKGWELHHQRSIGNRGNLQVIFRREFDSAEAFEAYRTGKPNSGAHQGGKRS